MILRIELRRSIALWAGAAVVLLALGVLYGFSESPRWTGPMAWTAQWTSAARVEREMLILLWPVAVGAGALQGLREHRSAMVELLSTASRPAWQRVARTAGAIAIAMVAAYLAVFAVGAVYLVSAGTRFLHMGWVAIVLVGALSLVAGAWLGLGLGRSVPFVLTPPAAVVVALALSWIAAAEFVRESAAGSSLGRFLMLAPGQPGAPDPFVTVAGTVNLGQAAALLGLAATGFLLAVAASLRRRVLAALPVVFGVAIAVAVLPPSLGEMYTEDREATALVCSGPVCMTTMHASQLATLAGPAQEALRLLATLPGAPTSVSESTVPHHRMERARMRDVVQMGLGDPGVRGATSAELTRILLAGAGTTGCGLSAPFARELAARTVAAAWFLGDLQPLRGQGLRGETGRLADQAWTALRALPADEQKARIVALREAELSCAGADPLAVLTQVG